MPISPMLLPLLVPPVYKLFLLYRIFSLGGSLFYYRFHRKWLSFILPDADNIRVYLPMDICKSAILRRLANVISHYGPATEANEMDFSYDVNTLISRIEIYDQVWFVRHCPKHGRHSAKPLIW